ncbi:MAG TPA: valine--tRNA ligase [Acidiferrobacteraceae bacterium]|nr:valine--tRNA ligase [Acidiferrobacteraceae bacterium]
MNKPDAPIELDKSYNPGSLEQALYQHWERQGYFEPATTGTPYCIMIPPPNVTGSLHMGHAFQDTLMDILARFQRMQGRAVLWQPGTAHAGIATQLVVERQLEAAGSSRAALGRERFLEAVFDWKQRSGGRITEQMRRLGASVAWNRERFTMDSGLSDAVREVFVRLHEEGLIYRGKRLVNWDPVLQTAVSDLEVTSETEQGQLWHIRYLLADDPRQSVTVATTRPETLLGDAAVAVHPDDARYTHLIGRSLQLPLTDRLIPVIADTYVDREFGSGCVKITPAHDFNDYEVGQRHDLPLRTILSRHATIDVPGSPYHGLDRFVARERIVADLQRLNLLVEIQPHSLNVPRGERSGAIIEPLLTDQWYVRTAPLAQAAAAAVADGRIRFIPENWEKTYFEWMDNIQDWCVSRQIWWGHRIPAWYGPAGEVYVARSEAEARTRHGLAADVPLRQDEDVLDTWFSSALWPFSTLGWPANHEDLQRFYPTDVLVTGFDIIFFWVARMIMMGLKFVGDVPFRRVYIHGLVRDSQGQKMSKSRGNVIDPIDLIDGIGLEELVAKRTSGLMQPQKAQQIAAETRKQFPEGIPAFGVDALRFTFASQASHGRNINFDLGRIDGYRNFCNKLWNATRYVLMNSHGQDCGQNASDPVSLSVADQWIISRLQETEQAVHQALADYRFDLAAQAIYAFVWDEYCSWYLELAKIELQGTPDASAARGTRRTLVRVLETTLRLLHPITPFITETLWAHIAPLADRAGPTIMHAPYPVPDPQLLAPEATEELRWVMQVVTALRTLRSERDVLPSRAVPLLLQGGGVLEQQYVRRNRASIQGLARISSVEWLAPDAPAPESALGLVGSLRLLMPLAGLIDPEAERLRLTRELEKTQRDLERARGKIGNANFVARAPQSVVEEEHRRIAALELRASQLESQRAQAEALVTR